MILFKDKETGQIIGRIDGRVHSEAHLKMWMGDRDKTERIIIEWKPVKHIDEKGKEVKRKDIQKLRKQNKRVRTIWEPDFAQKDLILDIENRKTKTHMRDFKFNKAGRLIKNTIKRTNLRDILGKRKV